MEQYTTQRNQLADLAKRIYSLCHEAGFADLAKKTQAIESHLINNKFFITVVGEFNRGKSTLVNAFLKEDIIPTAIRETTATINVISYATNPSITVVDKDGNHKPLDFSKAVLKEYTALTEFDPSTVDHIEIGYPNPLLEKGIVLVDTPGINDINEQRAEITYGFMPLSDATIFLLDSQKPFTATEQDFLKERILKNNISTLFFVVNKIDHLEPSKHEAILQNVKQKLAATFNSAPTTLYALSSDLALRGILENDENKLQRSKFTYFEEQLIKFLSSNERTNAFLRKVRHNLDEIAHLFLEEIQTQISQNEKKLDELLSQKENLIASETSMRSEFEEIINYLSTDESSLLTKIESTLLKRFQELHETLRLEIENRKTELTEYGEKVLPYQIRQATKSWLEQNYEAIEQFLDFSATNAAYAFRTSFSKEAILKRIEPSPEINGQPFLPKIRVEGEDQIQQTETLAKVATSVLFGGVAILTGGLSLTVLFPSVIGWSVGKGLVTPFFAKKILQEQKTELLSNLALAIREAQSNIFTQLSEYIRRYYSALKEQLTLEFDSIVNTVKIDIQNQIESFSVRQKEKQFERTRLDNLKSEIIHIQQKLHPNTITMENT